MFSPFSQDYRVSKNAQIGQMLFSAFFGQTVRMRIYLMSGAEEYVDGCGIIGPQSSALAFVPLPAKEEEDEPSNFLLKRD